MVPRTPLQYPLRAGLPLIVLIATLGHARTAQAQATDLTGGGRYLSQGILLAPSSIATEQSAFALSLNPAGLLFNPTSFAYIHEDGTRAETNARRSDGFFLRLGGLSAGDDVGVAAGLSTEWIRPPGGGCPIGASDTCLGRTSLGLAFGSNVISLGAAYRWYTSGTSLGIDGLGTFDMGLMFRPASWISTAFTVGALNAPTIGYQAIPRVYTLGLALRPVPRWLTIAVDYQVDDHVGWQSSRLAYLLDIGLPRGVDILGQLAHEIDPIGAQHLALEVGLRASFGYGAITLAEGEGLTNSAGGVAGSAAGEMWFARGESLAKPRAKAETLDIRKELSKPFGLADLLGFGGGLDPYTKLVLHLEQLEEDEGLDTLVVEIRGLDGLSLGRVEELRARFFELRRDGKKILVWLESGGDTEYYLATAADVIYAAPEAMLELNGLSTTHLFIRGLLDKLGVEPEFVKVGAYKSAPEMFTNSSSSEAAAEETNSLLDDHFKRYIEAVATARHKDVAEVTKTLSDGVFTASAALQAGLIDGVSASGPALLPAITKLVGHGLALTKVSFPDQLSQQWGSPASIAIIEVLGDIVPSSLDMFGRGTGSEETIHKLHAAMHDSDVKAIVLRIDSPGGDVGASELIWQAVAEAQAIKPVIASFGDVAASGGYYIATAAGTIIAEPSTITGSIGVFAGKADLSKLLDKLGVTTETFKRGEHADLNSLTKLWSPEERKIEQAMIDSFYETFLQHVAQARKMTRDQVHALAQGRVWTGAQAKERGLVDKIGGLEEALHEARKQGGLGPRARVVVPGVHALFDLPDVSDAVARAQGHGKAALPPTLVALQALLSSAGDREALERSWPVIQALMAGSPMAYAVDLPVVK